MFNRVLCVLGVVCIVVIGAVISWKLSVTGRFTYPERNLELFEEFRAHRVNRDQIRTLENLGPAYPTVSDEKRAELKEMRKLLAAD